MVRNGFSAALAAVLGSALVAGAAMAQQAPVVVGGQGTQPGGVAGTIAQAAQDQLMWELTVQTGTEAAYRNYLSRNPNGMHAAEARAALGRLQAGTPVQAPAPAGTATTTTVPVTTPAPDLPAGTSAADAARAEVAAATGAVTAPNANAAGTEAALGLSRETRQAVQAGLTRLGHDTRGVDGVFGSGTRRAITAWQQSRGYPATGYLNAAQVEELRISGRPGGAEPAGTATAAATKAALDLTATQRRIIQSRLTQMGHDTRGVDGKFGSGTRRAITAWQRSAGVAATGYLTRADADAILNAGNTPVVGGGSVDADAAARVELGLNLTREQRIAVQRGLVAAGHDTRGVDGQFGSGTRRAIRAWQVARGDAATGYLTRAQADALSGSAPVVVPAPGTGGSAGATAASEAALNLGAIERTEVQTRLAALGYDPRGIDGKFGSGTRAAIRSWQGDNGLTATGYLNADQLARLRGQRRN